MIKKLFEKGIFTNTTLYLCAGLAIVSLYLNFYNIDFSLGYHADEPKKINFLLLATQDFHHPILMLQSVRVLKRIIPVENIDQLVMLSRAVSAFCGMVIVLAVFNIAKTKFNRAYSALIALAVATSPIMVTHAHYFKEDMIFTACAMLTLLCLFRYIKTESLPSALLLGGMMGLTLSAQYKGALMIVLMMILPVFLPKLRKLRYCRYCLVCLAITVAVFVIINYPMLGNPERFFNGVLHESEHIATGHTLKIYPSHHFFSYHLIHSIIPGITLPLALLSLAGLLVSLKFWIKETDGHKILFLYCLIFYFAHEISPSKPDPDFGRYVIPVVPILIYFAFHALLTIFGWMKSSINAGIKRGVLIVPLMLVLLMPPLYDSVMINRHFKVDTRKRAAEWIKESGRKAIFECQATDGKDYDVYELLSLDLEKVRAQGVSYLVSSSFRYAKYARGVNMKGQDKNIAENYEKYQDLFSYPYVEIKPEYKTYGFSNPVIRIIDIRKPIKILERI